jgi:hypothetical protein
MFWNEITALAAIAASIAAFGAVGVAYKAFKSQEEAFRNSSEAFRLSIGADLVTGLEEKFDSEVLRRSRRSAASALLKHQNLGDAEDLFDFFEMVGLLSRLGALNDEMVHCMFFHWINAYWTAARDYIVKTREERTSVLWVDFQTVYERTRAIEKAKDPSSRDLDPSEQDLTEYLKQELEA